VKITIKKNREKTMKKITVVGLDLAKNVFHAVCCDASGKIVKKKMLKRREVLTYFANLESCLIGIEACASAHYWSRQLIALGHHVKMIAPQFVKAFVRGNKNNYNDALAISEAVTRPEMRFVAAKTIEQQDIQALHRLRERRIQDRTALCNQVRGLLAEYGLILPLGIKVIRKEIPLLLEDAENELSHFFTTLLAQSYQQLEEIDQHIDFYTAQVNVMNHQNENCERLQSIPGFGPIVSSVFYSIVGDGKAYRRGRDVSAAVGRACTETAQQWRKRCIARHQQAR
jgi:transposase